VSFVLALLAFWFAGVPSWAATVERVDVQHDRIVLTFDQSVADASSFVIASPQRIALDIKGAGPGGAVSTSDLVSAVRQGQHGDDGARVVFDLTRPAIVTEGTFGHDGRQLTLELRTVDDASFARAAAAGRLDFLPPFNLGGAAPTSDYSVSMAVPPPEKGVALPHVYGDPDRPLVVIDAGHGGMDPGAIAPGSGLKEKDVTLRIAKAIRDQLLQSGRVRVALTRDDDRYLVLQERYGIARKLHADLFISIHCDSVGAGDASGASVYTLSEVASDKEAAKLAARENRADIISGVDLDSTSADISSILIDLTQRETMNNSAAFARLLGREAQPYVPMKANFHRMASLIVLKAPDMPSILFETGYISNPKDAAFIDSAHGRHAIAQAVSDAVGTFFARRIASND
jgi:N-acetylmuramoyl-L-alanine amidase